MTSRYVMPFESRIKVMFENRSSEDVEVSLSALKTPWDWEDGRSMHFRAKWRVDHDLVALGAPLTMVQDLPFLLARGKGVYVGHVGDVAESEQCSELRRKLVGRG